MSLDSQIAALESADLIRRAQAEPELEYLFRHALVQDAVYGSLLRNNRRSLHQAVGELLEKAYAGTPAEHAAVLAHHFQQAGDSPRALYYLEMAGDAAAGQYALAEGVRHYGQAWELAQQMPLLPARELSRLALSLGRVLELSGRHEEALAAYQELFEAGERSADITPQLAALSAQAVLRVIPTPKHDAVIGARLLERALPLALAVGDRAAEARIFWISMVLVIYEGGDWNMAQTSGERAMQLTRDLLSAPLPPPEYRALRDLLGFILHDLFFVYLYLGMRENTESVLKEAVELLRAVGNLPLLAETMVFMCNVHLMTGRYDQALQMAAESRAVGDAGHHEYSQSYSFMLTGRIFMDRGEFGEALTMMTDAIVIGERAGNLGFSLFTRSDLAWGYAQLGAFQRALSMARRAQTIAAATVPHFGLMAQAVEVRLHLLSGDVGAAQAALAALRSVYTDLFALRSRLGAVLWAWSEVVLAEISASLSAGDAARALAIADKYLAELAPGGYQHFMPEALYLKGRALVAQDDVSAARQSFEAARKVAESLGARRHLWPILAALAEIARRQGNAAEELRLGGEAIEHIAFIADRAGDHRASFLALPAVVLIRGAG